MRWLPGKKGFATEGFRFLLALYIAFPVLSLLVAHFLLRVPAEGIVRILLSPLFYFSCALAIAAAIGLGSLQRWGWVVFQFSIPLLVYQTAYWVANFSSGETRSLLFGASLLVIATFYLRIRYEVRRPYFLPRIRWWELGSPSFCSLETKVRDAHDREADGEILDLSIHGCFVKTPFEVALGETVALSFASQDKPVFVGGTVVWKAETAVTHPRGLGIRFRALERGVKKSLKGVTSELEPIRTGSAARTSGSLGA